MAITRQISSNTLDGLAEQVSLAYEDKQGVNESGEFVRITGTGTGSVEKDTLGFAWGHSVTERTQEVTMNITNLLNQVRTGTSTTKFWRVRAYLISSRAKSGTLHPETGSVYLGVAATASLTKSMIINLIEGIFDVDGIASASVSGTTMTVVLDSGYSFDSGMSLEVLIDPIDSTGRIFGEDFPATESVVYRAAAAETNGTLGFTLFNPADKKTHDVSISILPTDGIGSIASKIVKGINGHVYNPAGEVITDFVTASSADVNNSAGTFKIVLNWHEIALVSTNSEATILDKTALVGSSLGTVSVTRNVSGTAYVISAAPDWDLFSTSSVLQPGGETTHFATLVKL